MGPKPATKPREYRGFTIELGHSGSAVMPRAAWARNDDYRLIKALGQTDREANTNIDHEIDKFWEGRRFG